MLDQTNTLTQYTVCFHLESMAVQPVTVLHTAECMKNETAIFIALFNDRPCLWKGKSTVYKDITLHEMN